MRAGNPAELKAALVEALAADAPVVIEVAVPTGGDTSPWPFIHPEAPEL